MKRIGALLLSCLSLAYSHSAYAWDPFGHMMVAHVAWQKLTPAKRARVSALLRENPDYDMWVRDVPENRRDEFAFMSAANWPDDIRSDPRFTDEGDPPRGPQAARNIGYADGLRHRYWHYINIPFSPDGTALLDPDPVNIQTQIRALRETLKSPGASTQLKSYDLVWLLHLVGDAHQPLHATARFTRAFPRGDRGGNDVRVCPNACVVRNPNLHAYWDGILTQAGGREQARIAARALAPANATAAAIEDETVWLRESLDAAKNGVYADPIGTGPGPYPLTPSYRANARKLAEQRIALAGARLARLIERTLQIAPGPGQAIAPIESAP
jgi:S1/P1 Nuclease